jgi:RND family efflux transporter MFP subunit
VAVLAALPALAACSHGSPPAAAAPLHVDAAMSVEQVFHAEVSAYGTLAGDARGQRALSLPQAGEVTAVEALAGQRARKGEALLTLATDPATHSAWLQARAALHLARQQLRHTEALHAAKLATNTQVDAAHNAVASAQAALAAAAASGGASATATLHAPAAGVVLTLNAHPGQRVAAGTTLLEFAPTAALVARLGVDPSAIAALHPGDPVRLRSAYAAAGTSPLAATVIAVGDAVDPQSHLVPVTAHVDGAANLVAGSAVTASIQTRAFKAWAVPRDALQRDADGTFVYQVKGGKAVRVDVRVLAPAGSTIGVSGALDPRAPVVTLGSYELGAGDAVVVSLTRHAAP